MSARSPVIVHRPYTVNSYDSCDVGTFPNQTMKDRSGPEAALHSDSSRSRYNYELSWLPGQRLSCVLFPSLARVHTFDSQIHSACTCSGEDHPGPDVSKGRGVPEIDILEAERNKTADALGQVVSQSAQFAPFTHDYLFNNDTTDAWTIYDPSITRENDYRGSAM